WDLGDYSEASDKKIIWRADAIQVMRSDVMREPTVLAASPGSNITGMHFDVIIMDDIINDDTVATPEKIAKTLRQIQDLESVLDPQRSVVIGEIAGKKIKEVVGDEQVINGTRYAKDDYYGYLQENLEYLGYKLFWRNIYVNKIDDSDGYVWGEKFNADHIEMLKRRAGAIRFSSQYLNKVIASEEVIFSQSMLSTFRADLSDMSQYGIIRLKIFNHEKKDFDYIDVKPYLIIDPAISQKKTADNSVIMVGGVDFARNLYVIDFKCGKFLPDDIVEKTYELAFKWSLKSIHIEVVSFQQALVYMFKTRFVDHFPLAVNEYRPRGEKKARIQTHLHPLFVNKKIWLAHWMQHHQELVDELNYFPSNTVHDDILDAMAMIVEIASPTPDKRKRRAAYDHFQANSKYGGRVR
ncbi:MAG: hypothetical protein ACRDEA_04795, partial [Microcystaceae cyanobacterium]